MGSASRCIIRSAQPWRPWPNTPGAASTADPSTGGTAGASNHAGICAEPAAARFETVQVVRPQATRESSYEVYVLGKKAGSTNVFLWARSGRTTIMEFLVMDDTLRRLVMKHAGMGELEDAALVGGAPRDGRGHLGVELVGATLCRLEG